MSEEIPIYETEERKVVSELLKLATSKIELKRGTYHEYREKIMALAVLHDLELQKTDSNKYTLRKIRRDYYAKQGIVVPPGEWDADLDMYNEREYSVHIGNGYIGKLRRNIMLSWNGYVIVPEKHWSIGKDLTYYDLPFEITCQNGREIGFDHCHLKDKTPLGIFFGIKEEDEVDTKYTSFIEVMKEVIHLGGFLQKTFTY